MRETYRHAAHQHVATLDAEDAALQLVPHLWFDQDWAVAAPAAIAAHNARNQGVLFKHLLLLGLSLDPPTLIRR